MGDRASLRGVFAFGFHGNRVPAEHVEIALGKRLLVQLAAFSGRSDGVEDPGIGNPRFGVVRNQLVAVRGHTDSWVTRLFDHGSLANSESPTSASRRTQFEPGGVTPGSASAHAGSDRPRRRSPGLSLTDQSGQVVQVSTVSSGP